LLPSAGDSMRIQGEEFGQDAIAAMSQLDRFQAGEQATLLFVEQAIEKQDSRFEFFGRYLKSGSIGYQRNRLGGLPGTELVPRLPAIGGSVQETSCYLRAAQTFGAPQIVEGILDFGMEYVGQFIGEPTARGMIDKGLNGGDESAVAGKPKCIVRPQAGVVETGSFAEGGIPAAVRRAGPGMQALEFAKDGGVGTGAESGFQLGQRGDFVAQEVLADGLGVEGEWTHNDIVPTA